jgi:hypothetical protein
MAHHDQKGQDHIQRCRGSGQAGLLMIPSMRTPMLWAPKPPVLRTTLNLYPCFVIGMDFVHGSVTSKGDAHA